MADMEIGQLLYKIVGDTAPLNRNINESNKTVGGLGKSLQTVGNYLKGALFLGAIGTAVAAVKRLGSALIGSASDAEETDNKFNVVFRNIQNAADNAADNLSRNFGLSSKAAKTLLSDTGDLLTGFGFTQESALELSDEVNKLAVDLASFTNFSGGAAGASQALTKALLGERESVKSLGISILEADVKAKVLENTQKGLTFATERQAKAYATLQLAQEQSKNAIGDFARSQESYANQTRIAQAAVEDLSVEIGKRLLPAATESIAIFAGLARKVADFIAERNKIKAAEDAKDDGRATLEQEILLLEDELKLQEKLLQAELNFLKTQGFENESLEDLLKLEVGLVVEANNRVVAARENLKYKILEQQSAILQNKLLKEDAAVSEDIASAEAERALKLEELKQKRKEITATYDEEVSKIEDLANASVITQEEALDAKIKNEEEFQKALVELGYDGLANAQGQYTIGDAQLAESLERKKELEAEYYEVSGQLADDLAEKEKANIEALSEQGLLEREARREAEKLAAEEEKELLEERLQNHEIFYSAVERMTKQALSAISALYAAQADAQIEDIDRRLQAELEAQGLAEETTVARLQRELEEAIAAGDSELAAEKERELARQVLIAAAEKEKAKVAYKAELIQWKLQKAGAIADAAAAILKTATSVPYPLNVPLTAAQATINGIQLAAIEASKPRPPQFATGGIVPGPPTTRDTTLAMLTPGEEVISENDARHSFSSRGQSATFNLYLDGNLVAKTVVNDYINNGRYIVDLKRGTR